MLNDFVRLFEQTPLKRGELNSVETELVHIPSETVRQHRNELNDSVSKHAVEAIARMELEQEDRAKQVTGITTSSDIIAAHLGGKPFMVEGKPEEFERFLNGEMSATSILGDESTVDEILKKNSELHRQVVDARQEDKIAEARRLVDDNFALAA